MVHIIKSGSDSDIHFYLATEPVQLKTLTLSEAQLQHISDNHHKKIRSFPIDGMGLHGYLVMP
jgi:hypothetical protein